MLDIQEWQMLPLVASVFCVDIGLGDTKWIKWSVLVLSIWDNDPKSIDYSLLQCAIFRIQYAIPEENNEIFRTIDDN